jgi:hypothetical protein
MPEETIVETPNPQGGKNPPTTGNAGSTGATETSPFITTGQVQALVREMRDRGADKDRFLKYLGVESLETIKVENFGKALEEVKKKPVLREKWEKQANDTKMPVPPEGEPPPPPEPTSEPTNDHSPAHETQMEPPEKPQNKSGGNSKGKKKPQVLQCPKAPGLTVSEVLCGTTPCNADCPAYKSFIDGK